MHCAAVQGMACLEGTSQQLRRHGDEFERLPGGYYRALGRCDDTMNLGGIKVPGARGHVQGFSVVALRLFQCIRLQDCQE